MSRIVDKPYFTYSAYNALTSGIQVKCPKCHGAGVVTADEDNVYFRCLSCGHQETRDRTIYRYDVHNQCKNCGRYYRVDIEDEAKQHFSVLHVACPYCGATMPGEVHKTAEAFSPGIHCPRCALLPARQKSARRCLAAFAQAVPGDDVGIPAVS